MTLVPLRETEQFKRGRNGEQLVADQLRAAGWCVIPSYDYSGADDHPPRMQGQAATYILPDLDVCRRGERRWAEVKTKTAPCMGRISGELEHGIPLRHFEHYQDVQRESGCPVYLFIYEEAERKLIHRKLDDLGPGRVSHSSTMSRGGMVYWLRRQFYEFRFGGAAP
jgi:hypothetical protein